MSVRNCRREKRERLFSMWVNILFTQPLTFDLFKKKKIDKDYLK